MLDSSILSVHLDQFRVNVNDALPESDRSQLAKFTFADLQSKPMHFVGRSLDTGIHTVSKRALSLMSRVHISWARSANFQFPDPFNYEGCDYWSNGEDTNRVKVNSWLYKVSK